MGWPQIEREVFGAPAAAGCPLAAVLVEAPLPQLPPQLLVVINTPATAPPTNTSCLSSASPNCSAARSSRAPELPLLPPPPRPQLHPPTHLPPAPGPDRPW